jgi:ribosomal-protein-alanine N-acetyltransferase
MVNLFKLCRSSFEKASPLKSKISEIRLFRREDLDRVIEINTTCLPENYSSYFYIDLYEKYPQVFLVAVVDGIAQGYVMCRMERSMSKTRRLGFARLCHVVSLAVMEPYRLRGIATALMSQVMENGVKYYGATECFLEVRVSNTPAINLYNKLGFKQVRRIYGYYMNGEDAFEMARPLNEEELVGQSE